MSQEADDGDVEQLITRAAELERAVEAAPDDAVARIGLANGLLELAAALADAGSEGEGSVDGQLVRAAVHAARAVGMSPDSPDARLALAASLGGLHLHRDELAELAWIAERRPDDPELAMVMEHALSHLGRGDEALAAARRAVELAGPEADVLVRAQPAFALARLGRVEEALAELEALAASVGAPDERAVPLGLLADLLEDGGRHDEALARLAEAAELAPGDGYDWARGNLLRELGRTEEAVACFAAEIDADPDDAYALRDWGLGLAELGRTDDAETALVRAARVAPLEVAGDAALARAAIRMAAGRGTEAVALLRDAIERDPIRSQLRHALAEALEGVGRSEEAAWELRQADRLDAIAEPE